MKWKANAALLLCYLAFAGSVESEMNVSDINTALMRSTFKLAGPKSVGTAFLLGRLDPVEPSKLYYVLVTAAHVLKNIGGDEAVLFLRKQQGDSFTKVPLPLQIRKNGTSLWTEHPKADVAVMYVGIPDGTDIILLPMSLLASDETLQRYEIHPGDVLSCLGYPYGAEANEAGFPILRSGQIASYPLTPTSMYPTFLYDFRVFGGNSGGPVFFVATNRAYGGSMHLGETVYFIAGLVSQEQMIEEEITSLTEVRKAKHQLSLAVVVQSSMIREAIERLPPKP